MSDRKQSPDDVVQVNRLGTQVTTRRGDLQEGEVPLADALVGGQQAREQQKESLSAIDEKVGTFVEGAVDALSLGLIRDRSDTAELRREVNSGSALAGEFAGSILGLKVPGMKGLAAAGEDVGKFIAKSAGVGDVLTRGAAEAGIAGSLGGAGALGHQAFDSLLEDKEFSMEAVAKDTGLSSLLGFGLGLLGGGLSKVGGRATKAEVAAQGGFMDPSSTEYLTATDHVAQAVRGMDDSLAAHEARHAGLRAIEDKGLYNLDPDLMKARADALKAARAARDKLPANVVAAMKNADPALSLGVDEYEEALGKLDSLMSPRAIERFTPQPLGRSLSPEEVQAELKAGDDKFWQGGSFEDHYFKEGEVPIMNLGVNAAMDAPLPDAMVQSPLGKEFRKGIGDPRAEYERIYGRPWEPVNEGPALPDMANMGGEVTPTSELGTNAGKARARTPIQQDASAALDALGGDRSFQAVPEGDRGFMPEWMPGGGKTAVDAAIPEGMKFPGGAADTAVQSAKARVLNRTAEDALHGQHFAGELAMYPDGAMSPAVDVRANAEAFAKFQDRMAEDTMARKARKAESLQKFRAEREGDLGSLAPAEPGEPNLSRGKGPEYRDTAVESAKDIKARNGQNMMDDALAKRIQSSDEVLAGRPMSEALAEQEARVLPPEFQNDDQLSHLNDFLGLKADKPPTADEAARNFIDSWYNESLKMGPRVSPGDVAAARIQQAADALYGATEGRADSVAALDLAEAHGMHQARGNLATRIQQVQLLPKAAEHVAALAKAGAAEGAGESAPKGGKFSNWAKRKIGGVAGAKVGAALGPIGSIVGYQLGAEAAGNYAKAASQMAGSAGRAAMRCAQVGEALLSNRKAGAIASAVGNRAYAYSPEGPVKDPVERILELQRVAQAPESIRELVRKQMGDLVVIHPQMAQVLEDKAVNQITSISVRAPHIYFDRMGSPLPPPAGEMRKFLEYENAAHNIDRTLSRMAAGTATQAEVDAMHDVAPKHMERVVKGILASPERLNRLTGEAKRRLETMTGIPLTGRSDPQFMAQQLNNWVKIQAGGGSTGKNNPQALKPGAQGMSTPGQGGLNNRAPGN